MGTDSTSNGNGDGGGDSDSDWEDMYYPNARDLANMAASNGSDKENEKADALDADSRNNQMIRDERIRQIEYDAYLEVMGRKTASLPLLHISDEN